MTDREMRKAAKEFAEFWKGKGYEKGQSQPFWLSLLREVYGVERPEEIISFEDRVHIDNTAFIDGYIAPTRVMIEQKSADKDLRKPIKQSDGSFLNPFQQAKRYNAELPFDKHARWIVTCNFKEFLIYDMNQPNADPECILLENLEREYYRLNFLVDTGSEHLGKEMVLSLQAGELVGRLYDALLKQYKDPTAPHTLRSLNILCVRLVFCFYAEDAGVFNHRDQFVDYLKTFNPQNIRDGLINLFKVLDTPVDKRDPYMNKVLAAFPYVNGGLFSEENVEIPWFTEEIIHLMLKDCSADFDWSGISPTIFGSVFESTLNPETRRIGGMHYTSIENIHKVIDPLFLNGLKDEFNQIKEIPVQRTREGQLKAFQDKLAGLTFLDPACGSGNFLTESYLSLRRLENEVIKEILGKAQGAPVLGFDITTPVKVGIGQFYGIEINDFAVTVAKTAMWISEIQMMAATEEIVSQNFNILPLKTYVNIVEGDALKMDWSTLGTEPIDVTEIYAERTNIVPGGSQVAEALFRYGNINLHTDQIVVDDPVRPVQKKITYSYIIGNPPYVGYTLQTPRQKEGILSVYTDEKGKPYKTAGKIDYIAGWFFKAAQLMEGTNTKTAFVSTNSITQGEQVSSVWKPLYDRFGIHIDFAYRTFRWDSESTTKAHVHCVIIGFSSGKTAGEQTLFLENGTRKVVKNINAYLIEAENVFIESRKNPLYQVPQMNKGSIPVDGGHLLLEETEYTELISKEPEAKPFIKPFLGASEFLHNDKRYCLWLEGVSSSQLAAIKGIKERVEAVRAFRLASTKEATRKYADMPTLFMEIRQPKKNYLLVPRHSSENRRYIPIGFISPDVICGDANLLIPDASLYHFGVLTSNVHMAWMRVVCGRIKSDYRYSNNIVYNNFPWPVPTEEQKQKIEQTAQAILDARAKYPNDSLASLYDETFMPVELRKAHQDNDRAVMLAYGFPVRTGFTESDCVAELMELYKQRV